MSTKHFSQLSEILSDVLGNRLKKDEVKNVMNAWESRKDDIAKIMKTSTKRKAQKDPNAPKRPHTGYIIFCTEKRDDVKKANPDLSATQITSKLAATWKVLPNSTKQLYLDKAAADKGRYKQELSTYAPPEEDDVEDSKSNKASKKRTKSAYLFYCDKVRADLKKANSSLKGSAITVYIGEQWKLLSPAQKAPYEKMAADAKAAGAVDASEVGASGAASASASPAAVVASPAAPKSKSKANKQAKEDAVVPAAVAAPVVPEKHTKASGASSKASKPANSSSKPTPAAAAPVAQPKPAKAAVAPVAPAKAAKTSKKEKEAPVVVKSTPGYEVFCREQRDEIMEDNPNLSDAEVVAELNKAWCKLSNDDRRAYEDEASENEDLDGEEVNA